MQLPKPVRPVDLIQSNMEKGSFTNFKVEDFPIAIFLF